MTPITPENNTGSEEHSRYFRKEFAIPFARPGNARDYAQTILGIVAVCLASFYDIMMADGSLVERVHDWV
jgi:hypothetical protein